jgi:hypothetical protein
MKTASISQCRCLTVLSRTDRSAAVLRRWDLDYIASTGTGEWRLLKRLDLLSPEDHARLDCQKSGTILFWDRLDALVGSAPADDETAQRHFRERADAVKHHLAMVFHRFLKGRGAVTIHMNGRPIEPWDPFLEDIDFTEPLSAETLSADGERAEIKPFVLPHHSRLSASEWDYYQDRSVFISNQGAYVYRNGRLMAWGDWFRLVPKGEATKLARVQIDFPNSLDEAWTIDIKKSRARPPHAVRERLRQIINQITTRSVTVHRGRGQKLFQETKAPLWERYADHGGIRFAINAEHPLVTSFLARLSSPDAASLCVLLDSIAAALPVEMIYSDYSTHPREVRQTAADREKALDRLNSLKLALYGDGPGDSQAFLQIVRSTCLFEGQIETAEKFIAEAFA